MKRMSYSQEERASIIRDAVAKAKEEAKGFIPIGTVSDLVRTTAEELIRAHRTELVTHIAKYLDQEVGIPPRVRLPQVLANYFAAEPVDERDACIKKVIDEYVKDPVASAPLADSVGEIVAHKTAHLVHVGWLIAVALILAIAMSAGWTSHSDRDNKLQGELENVTHRMVYAEQQLQQLEVVHSAATAATTSGTYGAATSGTTTSTSAFIVSTTMHRLKVVAAVDCWIGVDAPKGYGPEVAGLYKEGTPLTVAVSLPVTVRAGCPGATRYFLDGNEVFPANQSTAPEKSEVVTLR